jgi:phosphoribosylaminoimidazole-succinocarboxamide synthase
MEVVLRTEIPGVPQPRRGKVRDIYDLGEALLLVATDRVSAFDVVLPEGIPGKGRVLTQISLYWFGLVSDIIGNHVLSSKVEDFPAPFNRHRELLQGRSMLVRKAQVLPVECIVRGYLSGSGWRSYQRDGTVCGIRLPGGLKESSKLAEPIFTPSTKAQEGHDVNITFQEMARMVGEERAQKLRDLSLRIYQRGQQIAEQKGIVIADTKMEFGLLNGELILVDELLTPDSSRFWSKKDYREGQSQDSFDKQIIRDYLLGIGWSGEPPPPHLPQEVVEKTARRYEEILRILTS